MPTNLKNLKDDELVNVINGTIIGAQMAADDAMLQLPVEEDGEAILDTRRFFVRLERLIDTLLERVGMKTIRRVPSTKSPVRQQSAPKSGIAHRMGNAPFGFKRVDGVLVEDPEEQPTLRLIQSMRGTFTLLQMVEELNRRGMRSRRNSHWSYRGLYQLLRGLAHEGSTDG